LGLRHPLSRFPRVAADGNPGLEDATALRLLRSRSVAAISFRCCDLVPLLLPRSVAAIRLRLPMIEAVAYSREKLDPQNSSNVFLIRCSLQGFVDEPSFNLLLHTRLL
jgi:hypothetical protein